eukprot:6442567-Amphidinium_carterae.1
MLVSPTVGLELRQWRCSKNGSCPHCLSWYVVSSDTTSSVRAEAHGQSDVGLSSIPFGARHPTVLCGSGLWHVLSTVCVVSNVGICHTAAYQYGVDIHRRGFG